MENQTAIVIGRFQVPYLHLGHIHLISHALQNYATVLILLGESKERDERNPYTLEDRVAVIERIFKNPRLFIRALSDHPGDDIGWTQEVDENLRYWKDPVLLYSRDSFKDHYKGKYPTKGIPEIPGYSGTKLRKELKRNPHAGVSKKGTGPGTQINLSEEY